MHESVHRSPWPTLDEFADVPRPLEPSTYPAALAVIEAVRKAKADASKSMKAPVSRVDVTAAAATLQGIEAARDDLVAMLHIEELQLAEGEPPEGMAEVRVEIGEEA
jgi:valyl-tRNA synthetase